MGSVAALWRHPIKAHGRESVGQISLEEGQTFPWDRRYAVAHEAAKTDGGEWASCRNFSRAAGAPSLMAITAKVDEASGKITLQHPDLWELTFDPETQGDKLIDWVRPIMPKERAASTKLVPAGDVGMTDSNFPSIAIHTTASHKAVEQHLGESLSTERWRGNIWLTGFEAFEEFNWLGKTLRIGTAEIEVREQITRCLATTSNPATGIRDADTLGALQALNDHRDFGVYGVVTKSGTISVGDTAEVL
ncbi:MOSC domain-containing protein [Shimia sp. R11_0]|uniref:MOSC domain-containing protein n=1 Tax=Shimia sp. R11_0 TaxID=2821096 RepID=UPI001ADBA5F7|nr:MOSC N-terminal beta barrel domain-containing protein [Shimia sp. R11_0]MBO9478763.1 MOSC domain-containing protein [Shimia sp. R11_0]